MKALGAEHSPSTSGVLQANLVSTAPVCDTEDTKKGGALVAKHEDSCFRPFCTSPFHAKEGTSVGDPCGKGGGTEITTQLQPPRIRIIAKRTER